MTTVSRADAVPRLETLSADDRRVLLSVARRTLTDYFEQRGARTPGGGSPALLVPRGAFVTLTRRDTGDLRGCRGEMAARRPLVEAVARMAVAAATDDPRFRPVEPPELPDLAITINALTPLVPLRPDDIVVGRHGLMLVAGARSGVLLPEVPVHYGWDRDRFLRALCEKAGLGRDAWRRPEAELRGFEAETWSDAAR